MSTTNPGEQPTGKLPDNTIRRKIMVMSGKGGVGKSTIAVNLAMSLALQGKRVGLMDIDIHGPSIPKMLNLEAADVFQVDGHIQPPEFAGIKVMSIGLLVRDLDAPVIWRGPLKFGAIKQFLDEVEWGDLDFLVIDAPPGTGDEPLSVCQLTSPLTGAVVVTTPQDVATSDVRRSISFCQQLELKVIGVVENMSGFRCPHCDTVTEIFKSGGGENMAEEMGVPFLGRIPIDPNIGIACDEGRPFIYHYSKTETAKAFNEIVEPLLTLPELATAASTAKSNTQLFSAKHLKIAFPRTDNAMSGDLGQAQEFMVVSVDRDQRKISGQKLLEPPADYSKDWAEWLRQEGVNVIISSDIDADLQKALKDKAIQIFVGVPDITPEELVSRYLAGTLTSRKS